jgi:hypothetical protein
MQPQSAQEGLRQHTPEKLLLDTVQRLERFRAERRAVHIHLSRLKPYNRRELHVRIAVNTFENLVKQFDGAIFLLRNSDIVFISKGAQVEAIEEAVMRLRYLFSEDPLAQDANDEVTGGFCTWFDLERDYEALLTTARTLYGSDERKPQRRPVIAPAVQQPKEPAPERHGIDGRELGELIDTIQRADLSNLLRRQPVAALVPGAPPQVTFREVYLSIDDLRDLVPPGREITADRWLFQHLTQTLDQRMLKLLLENDDGFLTSTFSININVASILSKDFLRFDSSLRANARGTIVLELQLIDIFADVSAYLFAREFAKERNYRICLDSVSHHALPFVDRQRLGLDFIKVPWRAEMADLAKTERVDEFKANVEQIGKTRAILCHCDSEEAIKFGQSCGFAFFQGRQVDRILAPGRRRSMPTRPSGARPS